MPSTARRLKARLLQSANHSSEERWTVELSDLVVCGLPEHVKLVQFILQRRDNKKKMKATTVVETSMGEAKWTCRLQQPLTVYQSNGKTVPKYYELVVRGSETSEQKMEVVGRITVNISEYCTDTPARDHSPGKLSLKLKHAGSLKVCINAHMTDKNLNRSASTWSVGSDVSEVREYSMDGHKEDEVVQNNPFWGLPDSVSHDTEHSTHPVAFAPSYRGSIDRSHSLPAADQLERYMHELGDDSDDEEIHNRKRPWTWFMAARSPAGGKRSSVDSRDEGRQSPVSVLPSLNYAIEIANAGPSGSTIDLSAVEAETDPEVLRRKIQLLADERNELAYRNWALHATNLCLKAELDSSLLQLEQANATAQAAISREREAQVLLGKAELKLAAAQQTRGGQSSARTSRGAYNLDELQEALVMYKTQLAEAEFELLELRQRFRSSRHETMENVYSVASAPERPEGLVTN